MSTALVTIPEAARQLGVSPSHVRRLIKAQRLCVADIGVQPGAASRGARINQRDIDAFVASRTTLREQS